MIHRFKKQFIPTLQRYIVTTGEVITTLVVFFLNLPMLTVLLLTLKKQINLILRTQLFRITLDVLNSKRTTLPKRKNFLVVQPELEMKSTITLESLKLCRGNMKLQQNTLTCLLYTSD